MGLLAPWHVEDFLFMESDQRGEEAVRREDADIVSDQIDILLFAGLTQIRNLEPVTKIARSRRGIDFV